MLNNQSFTHHIKGNISSHSENHFRNKIVIISTILAIGIVFLHIKFDEEVSSIAKLTHQSITFFLHTCVPLFFAISGYLFFRGFSMKQYGNKLKRRIKSLLFPYLIWNIAYVFFMYLIYRVGFLNELSYSLNTSGVLKAIINAECSPLWFIRYLMLFVCIAPLTYFVLRHRLIGAIFISLQIVFNLYNYHVGYFNSGIHVNDNTLAMFNYQFVYFALGAYAALCWGKEIETKNKRRSQIALIVLCVMIVTYLLVLREHGNAGINHFFRLIWVPIFWFSFDLLPELKIRPWMKYTFLLYCTHMFVVYGLQGVISKIMPSMASYNPIFTFIEYLAIGVITIYVCLTLSHLLKIYCPRIHSIVSGNRG
ncbi:MAG: acyltransferase [Bacteroidales bacterium]|nr:acyltransferase [Bacteroidales bacterium]